jgi:hypothetical protein
MVKACSTKIKQTCRFCRAKFLVYPYVVRVGRGKFCSRSCHASFRLSARINRPCTVCGRPVSLVPARALATKATTYCSSCWCGYRLSPLAARFSRFVSAANAHGCLLWTGSTTRKGYGLIYDGAHRYVSVHRLAWRLAHGQIPGGMHVLHNCDQFYPVGDITNRRCVNPAHLFLGTNTTNSADMVAKGRQAIGARNSSAKFTDAVVRKIRKQYATGKYGQRQLAQMYNVRHTTIRSIVLRLTWTAVA